jgi:hypothetical protein
MRIIGHKLAAKLLLENGVAAIDNVQHAIVHDGGATISPFDRQGG